jgi:hypothetical protein
LKNNIAASFSVGYNVQRINMTSKISEKQKFFYDTGLFMMVIGGCLFVLPFIAILFVMISDTPSEHTAKVPMAFIGGFIGFVLFAAGGVMRNLTANQFKDTPEDCPQENEKSA